MKELNPRRRITKSVALPTELIAAASMCVSSRAMTFWATTCDTPTIFRLAGYSTDLCDERAACATHLPLDLRARPLLRGSDASRYPFRNDLVNWFCLAEAVPPAPVSALRFPRSPLAGECQSFATRSRRNLVLPFGRRTATLVDGPMGLLDRPQRFPALAPE